MIIGKYTAYVSSAGGCGKTRDGKWYWREGAYNSAPFNTCAEAQRDWDKKFGKLNITKHPDSTAKGGGISANTYQPKTVKATDWITGSSPPKQLQSRFTPSSKSSAASNTVKVNANAGAGAGAGRAGTGVGASITASVSDLQSKTSQIVSDVLPDVIEDKLPSGFPLWILPVGLVGVLALILIAKR